MYLFKHFHLGEGWLIDHGQATGAVIVKNNILFLVTRS
jgi:hypothetical protein